MKYNFELSTDFKKLLSDAIEKTSKLSYIPLFSTGTYICASPNITCDQALIQADSELYKDKEERHKAAPDFVQKLEELKKNL